MASSRPISPVEQYPPRIQSNAHPYPIKTTSSALLSRSTSSPHSIHPTKHRYVPPQPSQIPRVRHHHSSSLSSLEGQLCDVSSGRAIHAPLPTPPSAADSGLDDPFVSLKPTDEPKPTHRTRRAETMPSSATVAPITGNHSCDRCGLDRGSGSQLHTGLYPDPRQWNTDELVTYLEMAFNLGVEDKEVSGVANILECVRARGLTGRALLRLTDADLVGAPLSDAQRAQLLEHSRTLRADVLRGRISVDHLQRVSDQIYSQSPRLSASFSNIHSASASADNLHILPDNITGQCESILPLSPFMSLQRSNSISEATAQRYRDLARMRMRRRGKVKGLVETWERASTSGSECSTSEEGSVSGSGSEAGSESEIDGEFGSIVDHSLPLQSSDFLHDEPPHCYLPTADPALAPQESIPPPPYIHVVDQEEEPTVEELLASSSSAPLRGARAWEADFGLGETVKRVPVPLSGDADSHLAAELDLDTPCRLRDNGHQTNGDSIRSASYKMPRNTGSRKRRANARKRVVTAIFTGSPPDNVSEDARSGAGAECRRENAVDSVVRDGALDSQDNQDNALRALEESFAATRVQLEVFRLRLEEVEADTIRQEELLARAPLSDAQHSGLKQRRSKVNGIETADARSDEVIAASGKNVLEMSLADIARALVANAMQWLRPYGVVDTRNEPYPRPGANPVHRLPVQRTGGSPLARVSCSILLVSFAICAAVLRRMGFGRWIRRP